MAEIAEMKNRLDVLQADLSQKLKDNEGSSDHSQKADLHAMQERIAEMMVAMETPERDHEGSSGSGNSKIDERPPKVRKVFTPPERDGT